MKIPQESLPRLLYIADLPVAPTQAGAILMYRLLEQWPADKLMVCTPTARTDCPLPGVKKIEPPRAPLERLFFSRVAYEWMTTLTLFNMARRRWRKGRPLAWLEDPLAEFSPQAVLTVSLAGAWMEADAVAGFYGIPFHVVIHDDHDFTKFWIPSLRKWGEGVFAGTYRRAKSRFCISRTMEATYRTRFGVAGDVLLPSRGRDSVSFDQPRPEGFGRSGRLKVFYAGSVYGEAFKHLEAIASSLAEEGHRLIVYTPSLPPPGFTARNLEIRAPLPSGQLVRCLHEEADVLLLLTTFAVDAKEPVKTSFPSKFVDYTGAAVPVLVVTPPTGCLVDYLAGRPAAGELLCDASPQAVKAAVCDLASRPDRMSELARGAVLAGAEDFGHEQAFTMFSNAIRNRK